MTFMRQIKLAHPFFVAVFVLAAILGWKVLAQDKPKDPQATYDPRSSAGVGQQFLQKFVGDWSVDKVFHPRTGDPVTTKGVCHQSMINEGKFLQSDFVFYDGPTNSTGLGLVGFEASSGLFTSIWADSRSTKMSIRQSKDPFDGTQIIMSSFPIPGGVREERLSRNVTHLLEDGHKILHQQYAINPDNTERLVMELILTRKSP